MLLVIIYYFFYFNSNTTIILAILYYIVVYSMSSSDTDCISKLQPLLNSYEILIDNYSKVYNKHLQEYTNSVSVSYDMLLDTKNTPKHSSVRTAFNNLIKKKKEIDIALRNCEDITYSTTLQLLEKSIALNKQLDTIEKQNKKIKRLQQDQYSSLGQEVTLEDTNIFIKKNIVILIIIIVILIIILNYLIFNR